MRSNSLHLLNIYYMTDTILGACKCIMEAAIETMYLEPVKKR